MRKILKHGSTVALIVIVLILLIPSWRISFQGWFQGIFMSDLELGSELSIPLTLEAETWNLADLDGNQRSLNSFNEKPVILSFWATWCPPCRAELKELKKLKEALGNDIHFIAASDETVETILNSGLDKDYDFLFSTAYFPSFFKVEAYPTLCIIDNNRNMIFKHSGAGGLDNEKNRTFLNRLIENQ